MLSIMKFHEWSLHLTDIDNMANYKYVCTNNQEHLFEEPTTDHWCNICDISTHPMLKPIDQIDEVVLPIVPSSEPINFVENEEPIEAITPVKDPVPEIVSIKVPEPEQIEIPLKVEKEVFIELEPLLEIKSEVIEEVKIGNQIWMSHFLNRTTFKNDEKIFHAKTTKDWAEAKADRRAAWCYPNNDSTLGEKIGLLYNFYAVTDPEGIIPDGWEIPTLNAINELQNFGPKSFIDEHLRFSKHKEISHRLALGTFVEAGEKRLFWTQNHNVVYTAFAFSVHGQKHDIEVRVFDKSAGFFVRCIKKAND
jgi:hypothetical protein